MKVVATDKMVNQNNKQYTHNQSVAIIIEINTTKIYNSK